METTNYSKWARADSLFGGIRNWTPDSWVASDDRVRGGKSESHLTVTDKEACFHGNLDIDTLGGAGFASQRTSSDLDLDLSAYDGLQLWISKSDGKEYTFTLKDEKLPQRHGRDQATISWEYTSAVTPEVEAETEDGLLIPIMWSDFTPTYRGKEVKDAGSLNLKKIKQISLMNRSFFGTQKGPFSLTLRSIAALKKDESDSGVYKKREFPYPFTDEPEDSESIELSKEKAASDEAESRKGFQALVASCFGCGRE